MEIELIKDRITGCRCVFSETQIKEESIESVVPDTMPDVQRIVDTDAAVFLRSKEIDEGRLTVTGSVEGFVLYLPEEGGRLCRLSLSAPCSFTLEDAGITEDGWACVNLRCCSAEARLLNPRKVQLRADVAVEVSVYREAETEYICGAEEPTLQKLCRTETVGYVAAVQEKTFVVAEEFTLPAAGELLFYRAEAVVEDAKPVGDKLIVQGNAALTVLCAGEEGTKPEYSSFTTAFSQVIDMGTEQSSLCRVELMPTACYVEQLTGSYGAESVSMEMHLVAQVIARGEREVKYLSDVYSNRCPCRAEREQLNFTGSERTVMLRETVRETLECPDNVREVIFSYVLPGRPTCAESGVRLPLAVHVLYITERGECASLCRKLSCEAALSLPEGAQLRLGAPLCGDPFAVPARGGVDFRVTVELAATLQEEKAVYAVSGITLDTEAVFNPTECPSVMVVRNPNGDLWSLAKKYHSTVELIDSANPQGVENSAFLLIPRAR